MTLAFAADEFRRSQMTEPARLLPDEPFPPYSYVSGYFPHPVTDPAGHMFGREATEVEPLRSEAWQANRPYLFGIDLFNHGFYWEAHEAWEALWHAAGRSGTAGSFLKGLIKLAAAGVKAREGNPRGTRRHAQRAKQLFGQVKQALQSDRLFGLTFAELMEIANAMAGPHADAVQGPNVSLRLPVVLMPREPG